MSICTSARENPSPVGDIGDVMKLPSRDLFREFFPLPFVEVESCGESVLRDEEPRGIISLGMRTRQHRRARLLGRASHGRVESPSCVRATQRHC